MESRRLKICIVFFNCVLINCLVAKPFSLNDAITAESQQKQAQTTSTTKLEETLSRILLPKVQNILTKPKLKVKEISLKKRLPPLKYRKAYQIKTPLKPEKPKYSGKFRNKRKNQAVKREVNENENLIRKYVPLLKNLGMLFNNILGPDKSGSHEIFSKERKQYDSDNNSGVCTCAKVRKSKSQKETVTSPALSSEIASASEATSTPTTPFALSDVGSFRQNKDIPVLLSRNTTGTWGNYHGLRARNRSAHHRRYKGHIAGDYRHSKHNTAGPREDDPDTESYEENTCGVTRDDASRFRFRGKLCRDRNNASLSNGSRGGGLDEAHQVSKAEDAMGDIRRGFNESQEENRLENRGHEAESTELLSEPIRGLRRSISQSEVSHNTESKETDKKSDINVPLNSTGHQQIISIHTKENKKVRAGNEAMIPIKDLLPPSTSLKSDTPLVMIIDGYSVARDKYGENKRAEKAIQIHS